MLVIKSCISYILSQYVWKKSRKNLKLYFVCSAFNLILDVTWNMLRIHVTFFNHMRQLTIKLFLFRSFKARPLLNVILLSLALLDTTCSYEWFRVWKKLLLIILRLKTRCSVTRRLTSVCTARTYCRERILSLFERKRKGRLTGK